MKNNESLVFVHSLRTRSLVECLSTDLPSTYKGLLEKNFTRVKAREVGTNGTLRDRRDNFKRSKKSSWDNIKGQKNKDRFSPYQGTNHGLLLSLSKSPKEILATEKAARSFEPPPKMFRSKRSRDMSKKEQVHPTPHEEKEKKDKGTTPVEAPIHMASQEAHISKILAQENTDYEGKKIIFPLVAKVNNAPVIIEAKIFRRKARRVYMDVGSSCEIIYEHCLEKLNPTIKATKVDLNTSLVGLSRERSWSIGEIGEGTKRAIKIFATNEERILSCVNAGEKIIVNNKVPFEVLLNRLQGLPTNSNGRRRQRQNNLLRGRRNLLLQKDVVWPQKCRGNKPKLNPKKCSFGIEEGPFLGHLITKQGIKLNTLKVKEVTDLDQPRKLKYIQSLNEKLAALSQFLSKVTERSLDFFKVHLGCKDKNSILWTTEADKVLEKMKKIIQTLPTLTAPRVEKLKQCISPPQKKA
uniref:Reverse transcriptase domain-containing protein n=1 Tax=Tanacetum cinerariifolium TaxID=118510 RepID=A0A699I6Y1_TANCI|nr:reverse transcriptase domain-containing protein [Tanacetum cinerariifolium]